MFSQQMAKALLAGADILKRRAKIIRAPVPPVEKTYYTLTLK